MTTTTTSTKPWDFSLALEFANSLPLPKADLSNSPPLGDDDIFHFDDETFNDSVNGKLKDTTNNNVDTTDPAKRPATLGDLTKVWQFLGAPSIDPESSNSPGAHNIAYGLSKYNGYSTDGSIYTHMPKLSSQNNQLSDGTEGFSDEPATPPSTATLPTKTQRKKARRKIRRPEEQQKKDMTASESEADPIDKSATPSVRPAHHDTESIATPKNSRPAVHLRQQPASASKSKQSNELKSPMGIPATLKHAANAVAQALATIKSEDAPHTPSPKPRSIPPQQHTNRPAGAPSQPSLGSAPAGPTGPRGQHTNIYRTPASSLIPSSIVPMVIGNTSANGTTHGSPATATLSANANTPKPKPKPVIAPRISRSRVDRDWALLNKIIVDQPQDRKYLLSPMNLTTHSSDPSGIHVFVDASNIFIGFNDRLKASRNIHFSVHLPIADMSFDSLALIMERRRPIAKRALAGSTPHVPAFDKAKAVGYECSILEKVYKARQITERQQYFNQNPHLSHGRSPRAAPPCNTVNLSAGPKASKAANGSGSGSGSETNTPQYAPPAMVEQCVDEILHLKMLESIIDYDTPSTMVLATGDAAAAEYSGGFQKMAQRALMKGWKVELVTWRKGLNGMYINLTWTRTWGDQFKIIYLDDYAEELLDIDGEEDESN